MAAQIELSHRRRRRQHSRSHLSDFVAAGQRRPGEPAMRCRAALGTRFARAERDEWPIRVAGGQLGGAGKWRKSSRSAHASRSESQPGVAGSRSRLKWSAPGRPSDNLHQAAPTRLHRLRPTSALVRAKQISHEFRPPPRPGEGWSRRSAASRHIGLVDSSSSASQTARAEPLIRVQCRVTAPLATKRRLFCYRQARARAHLRG